MSWKTQFLKNGRLTEKEWPMPDAYPEDPAEQLALLTLWEKGAILPDQDRATENGEQGTEKGKGERRKENGEQRTEKEGPIVEDPCPYDWAEAWQQLATGSMKNVVPEALLMSIKFKLSIPAEALPHLAKMALRDPILCRRLLPIWGERGRRFLKNTEAYRTLLLDEEAWKTGSSNVRIAYFSHLRQQDPDAARQLAMDHWSKESLGFRKQLIDAFFINLGPADEEFLMERASDRSKEIAGIAWGLLGRVRKGAGEQRRKGAGEQRREEAGEMVSIMVEFFHEIEPGKEIEWPEELMQLVKATPAVFKGHPELFLLSILDPADTVASDKKTMTKWLSYYEKAGKSRPLHHALITAGIRHRQVEYLKALIGQHIESPAAWKEAGRFLSPAAWNELALVLLRYEEDLPENRAYQAMMETPPLFWSADHAMRFFSRYVEWRLDPMSGIQGSGKAINEILEKAAVGVPPEMTSDMGKAWNMVANPFLPQSDPVTGFFDTLEFRNELRKICLKR